MDIATTTCEYFYNGTSTLSDSVCLTTSILSYGDLILILGFILACVMFIPLGFIFNTFIKYNKQYD